MSKGHVEELKQVYTALFKDAVYAYPALSDEFERDLNRVLRLVESRGIHLFVVDLPKVGKHFDKCLAASQYSPSGLPLTKRYTNGVVIPKFLRGLYLLVFDEHGRLREECDTQAVFFIRQICLVAKKTSIACSEENVRREVEEFFSVDQALPDVDNVWLTETPSASDFDEYTGFSTSTLYRDRCEGCLDPLRRGSLVLFLKNLDTVSGFVSATLGAYNLQDWRFKHGPGAVAEVTGPSNKYSWKGWSTRLDNAFPISDCGYHNYGSWMAHTNDDVEQGEPYSRLISVPKTYSRPRLIAAEPGAHQWCQQNIWHYFCTRTRQSWINGFVRFRDQSLNQQLCVQGSRHGDLITVDLSSASDRVTCHAVGQMFRVNKPLLLALQATRTTVVRQDLVTTLPRFYQMRKFSTMGSACTFPVQSLMFMSIAIAAVLTSRNEKPTPRTIRALAGEVAVFGDDIIAPKDSRDLLYEGLSLLDFKVNVDKSFSDGLFRESCGVDSFMGENVTPSYWRSLSGRNPDAIASTVSVQNNFYSKFLLNAAECIASTIPEVFPQVGVGSGVAGIEVRTEPIVNAFKTRFNKALQRMETLVPTIFSKERKSPISDDSGLHQYFTEAPDPHVMWQSGVPQRPSLKVKRRWVPTDWLTVK